MVQKIKDTLHNNSLYNSFFKNKFLYNLGFRNEFKLPSHTFEVIVTI